MYTNSPIPPCLVALQKVAIPGNKESVLEIVVGLIVYKSIVVPSHHYPVSCSAHDVTNSRAAVSSKKHANGGDAHPDSFHMS